jgi:DNA-binding transcriptional MerR regulator
LAVAQSHSPRLKSPEAYRTISEVATDLELPQHVLRFWETRFPQIRPMKKGGGRRYYRHEDVELIQGIRAALYGSGLTIRGVLKIIKEQGLSEIITMGHKPFIATLPINATQDEEAEYIMPKMMLSPVPLSPKISMNTIFGSGLNNFAYGRAIESPKAKELPPSAVKFALLEDEPEDLPAFMSGNLPTQALNPSPVSAPAMPRTKPKFAPVMQEGLSAYDMQQLQFALNELVECRRLLD